MSEVLFQKGAGGAALVSPALRLTVDLDAGTFSLWWPDAGRAVVDSAGTAVILASGVALSSRGAGFELIGTRAVDDALGRGLALWLRRRSAPGEPVVEVELALYDDVPFGVLRSELRNGTGAALRVQAFQVLEAGLLRLGRSPRGWRFYKQGWQNWSPALFLPCGGEDLPMAPPVVGPTTQPPPQPGLFLSEMVTAVVDPESGLALTAGFISTADQFSQVWLDRACRALSAASYADGIEVPPAGRLASERLLIEPTRQPLASLERYGDALASESGATPWPGVVTGWCSWYYYWQGIHEEQIVENLDFLARRRDELPVEYVQIDDGYQAGIGDWLTPNEKFPHGMGWLAEQVHARGFKAGLWLAPFMIGADSRLWGEHPDWAVQYKPGKPYIAMINWQQNCYAMDLTRPDAIEWLDRVFTTVSRDWGYDYVKVDFLYAGAVDGLRHDANVTRAQAYRRGMETIRGAMGDKFVLGCGNPIAPSIGLVHGSRIGPDVAPFWYPAEPPREAGRSDLSTVSTINGIRNIVGRYWMHGRLWLNDPDCLLARDCETALTLDEVRTLTTVIGMSGGMMMDSDNLLRLSEERRQLISVLLPPVGRSAAPLDLFDSPFPDIARLFELDCGTHRLLAVFNWDDSSAEVAAPLPPEAVHVFEMWSEQYLGLLSGGTTLSLPAHGCALLALRPDSGRPQLLGSSFHFAQGAVEVAGEEWDGETLRLSLRPAARRDGRLFLHVRAKWSRPALECHIAVELQDRGGGLLVLGLTLDRPLDLRLRFSRV